MTAPLGNAHNLRWAAAHDAALAKHLAADMSMSEAAAAINYEFKTEYSRNAVIGRANRLGIKSNVLKSQGTARHKAPLRPKPIIINRPKFVCEPSGLCAAADVIPRHVPLIDLEPVDCRWPYGDGPFTFCGCPAFGGGSYCEPHLSLSMKGNMQGVNYDQSEAQRAAHRKVRIPTSSSLAYVGEDFA